MKRKEKEKAIKLRKKGKSYSEILKKVNASKGTISNWLRDIKLTKKQQKRLIKKSQKHLYDYAKKKQRKKKEKIKRITKKSQKQLKNLTKNPLFLPGLMLYWAEGDKSEQGYCVKFTNSDSAMIKFMMNWFRKICKVPENKFRISIQIHSLNCNKKVKKYWSKITNIPTSQFYKSYVKKTSLGQRKNKPYNGTCAIRINDIDLLRKIKGWILGFKKNYKRSPRSLMDKAGLF